MLRYSRWDDVGLAAGLGTTVDPSGTLGFETVEGRIAHPFALGEHLSLTLTADAARTEQLQNDVLLLPPGAFYVLSEAALDWAPRTSRPFCESTPMPATTASRTIS